MSEFSYLKRFQIMSFLYVKGVIILEIHETVYTQSAIDLGCPLEMI